MDVPMPFGTGEGCRVERKEAAAGRKAKGERRKAGAEGDARDDCERKERARRDNVEGLLVGLDERGLAAIGLESLAG